MRCYKIIILVLFFVPGLLNSTEKIIGISTDFLLIPKFIEPPQTIHVENSEIINIYIGNRLFEKIQPKKILYLKNIDIILGGRCSVENKFFPWPYLEFRPDFSVGPLMITPGVGLLPDITLGLIGGSLAIPYFIPSIKKEWIMNDSIMIFGEVGYISKFYFFPMWSIRLGMLF